MVTIITTFHMMSFPNVKKLKRAVLLNEKNYLILFWYSENSNRNNEFRVKKLFLKEPETAIIERWRHNKCFHDVIYNLKSLKFSYLYH